MRSSLSLCPLWALWVQETRFWGSWQSSDFGTFRNPARLQSKWEWPGFKCRWVLSLGLRPTGAASHSAQTHGGRFPLCSDPSSAAFMSLWSDFIDFLGFPGGSAVINLPAVQETWVPSLSQEDAVLGNPWTEEPGALQSMGSQSQTQLSDETTTALLSKQSMYYCSKLWKILITRKEDI